MGHAAKPGSEKEYQKFAFTEHMAGGAFVCRVGEGHELLYANENMVRLFECEDYADFVQFVGNSYDGMVTPSQLNAINKELELQVRDLKKTSGHLFYHVRTKKGNLHLVEEHWSLVNDETEGLIYYSFIVSREFDNNGADFDPITGLYGRTRFHKYVSGKNRQGIGKEQTEYAIVYLNFVNFKLLNINQGIEEGDACLRTIADILCQVFPDAFLARLSDDHFTIFTEYETVFEKIDEFNRTFHNIYGSQYDIIGKCGVYRFAPTEDFDVETALSYAKVACDYIKYDSTIDMVEYTEKLARRMQTSEHVIRKLDEALEKEWIKIFYQPVVRSITEQLCGMESLVRWHDPEIGFILPNEFIKTLEDNRQIHKLDCYVVERVCKCIHERMQKKQPVVPISVNFSRLDFAMCDMVKFVEDAVEKYDVPRDFIHIEITESMIASDEELMKDVISRFRKAGYEIWMDDFGSGYSSLTLLKDYQFDMLKLDMRFLTPFTEKAKEIVRHTITMAKDIGIKTLAEGVETKDQLEFLKEVGCGQIQGYYYGRPQPMDEMFANLREKSIPIEKRKWRSFYQAASREVRATQMPLEVIEYDGKNFITLFMNRSCREQIIPGYMNLSQEEIDKRIYNETSPLTAKYREFLEQLKKSGKTEIFYYTANGSYLRLKAKIHAKFDGHYIISATLINISSDQRAHESERLDTRIREINNLFEVVLLANISKGTIFPLLGSSKYVNLEEVENGDIGQSKFQFVQNHIYPTERERYKAFTDFSTAWERLEREKVGYFTEVFRIKQEDGTYSPKEISIMIIPGTEGAECLYCMKPCPAFPQQEGNAADLVATAGKTGEQGSDIVSLMWENLLCNSSVKFFWKDKDRRFLGASQAFLDYYGIKSLDEIVGKTDEEMSWHLDDEPYKEDEVNVLTTGARVSEMPGQCIVRGVVRSIASSKMPIYRNGEIIGLVGYFVDREERASSARKKSQMLKRDSATGLMNARALVECMIDYALQYHNRGRNYGLIVLQNSRYARILETYDEKFANTVLKEMGKKITDLAGQHCAVARTKDSVFVVLSYVRKEKDFHDLAERMKSILEDIREVDGNPITLRIRMAVKIRTDDRITDENIYDVALREISEVI